MSFSILHFLTCAKISNIDVYPMKNKLPILIKGDEIKIVSSARKISNDDLEGAIKFLKENGFNPSLGSNLFKSHNQFAGSDQERLDDLQNAMDDPQLKAIWMARGGYGTHRIISKLDLTQFMKHPKWVIGYSDVTVLHCFLNRNGFASLHATMPINFKNQSMESFTKTLSTIKGSSPSYTIATHPKNIQGQAKGKVLGGNLSILYSLTGSEILPNLRNAILFFEDLDEYLYHIDRMMMNLELSGVLNSISGVLIGGLSNMNDNAIPYGKSADEIVYEHLSKLGIPICFGFPAGHQKENLPLIFGVEAELIVSENEVTLSY